MAFTPVNQAGVLQGFGLSVGIGMKEVPDSLDSDKT